MFLILLIKSLLILIDRFSFELKLHILKLKLTTMPI